MKKSIAGMLVLSSILIGLTSCMSLGASLGTSTKNKKDYQYYFEFIPDEEWIGVPYLQANPYEIEIVDGALRQDQV